MAGKAYEPMDLGRLRTVGLAGRGGLVNFQAFAKLPEPGASFAEWFAALPDFLGARQLQGLARAIVAARRAGRPVIAGMGGHLVKVGCGPILCDLMRRGVVTALAMNGASSIHDTELALAGQTSEDVGATLATGVFGMTRDPAEVYAEALERAAKQNMGLGRAIGCTLLERRAPYAESSILATAARLDVPATVHVAMGTDVVHMHPNIDAGRLGEATLHDFRILCSIVADLQAAAAGEAGGVYCNIGSAVLLPEVFLKTVAVARNLGLTLSGMVTANLDMMRQYRTKVNVLDRPTAGVGTSFEVIGQHEILLPLLRQAVVEMMA